MFPYDYIPLLLRIPQLQYYPCGGEGVRMWKRIALITRLGYLLILAEDLNIFLSFL